MIKAIKTRILLFLLFSFLALLSLIHPGPGEAAVRRAKADHEKAKRERAAGATPNP